MIEFQIIQDGDRRAVMDKFTALVEKSGVVFVGFDYKFFALAQSCRHTEILRHTTDQKTRIAASGFQQEGEYRGCRSFPVRTGNGQRRAFRQLFPQPLGPEISELLVNTFQRRIARDKALPRSSAAYLSNVLGRYPR